MITYVVGAALGGAALVGALGGAALVGVLLAATAIGITTFAGAVVGGAAAFKNDGDVSEGVERGALVGCLIGLGIVTAVAGFAVILNTSAVAIAAGNHAGAIFFATGVTGACAGIGTIAHTAIAAERGDDDLLGAAWFGFTDSAAIGWYYSRNIAFCFISIDSIFHCDNRVIENLGQGLVLLSAETLQSRAVQDRIAR
jgi:hypothetical protein